MKLPPLPTCNYGRDTFRHESEHEYIFATNPRNYELS